MRIDMIDEPLIETNTSQSETTPTDKSHECNTFWKKFYAFILILGRFCSTFIGTTTYFYMMIQLIFTYFERLLTDMFLHKIYFLISNISSIFISLPLIHLLFYQIILLFFSFFQDLKQFLNFKEQIKEVCTALDSPKKGIHIFIQIILSFIYIYQLIFVVFVFVVFLVSLRVEININISFIKSYRIILFISIYTCVLLPVIQIIYCMYYPGIKFVISDLFLIDKPKSRSTINHSIEIENRTNNLANENPVRSDNPSLNAENTVEKYNPLQILNPFFFLNDQEYKEYIDEAYSTTIDDIFHHKMYVHSSKIEDKKKMRDYITIIIVFLITLIVSITFEIWGNISYNHKALEWGKFALSMFFELFFVIFSFTSIIFLFTHFSLVKNRKNIYYLWIAVLVLVSVMLFFSNYLLLIFQKPRKINYTYSPIFKNLTIENPALICSIDYYGLDLVQYAGLAALGHSTSEKNADEIVKLLFSDTSMFKNISTQLNETKYGHSFQIKLNESLSIVAINSLIDLQDYAFVLENFLTDVATRKAMSLIPMFETLFNYVFFEIINYFSEFVISSFNNNLASTYFSEFIYNTHENIEKQNINVVYTGYSAGGMLAKTLGIEYNVPSIAFNSLQTYYSTFSHMYKLFINNQKMQKTKHKGPSLPFDYFVHRNTVKMINLYSPNQILSMPEKGPTINIEVPNVKIKDSIEMMCLIASGCDVTGKYDDFCLPIIGSKKYKRFFDSWNRSRSYQI